jgi:alpha-amylase
MATLSDFRTLAPKNGMKSSRGIEPIADIVINHRDGSQGWADFRDPDWGMWAITRNDEAFTNPNSEVFQTPVEHRGAEEERPQEYALHSPLQSGH